MGRRPLRAWWDVVGGVDLTGEHDLLSARSVEGNTALGTLLIDPLVVYPPHVTLAEFEEIEHVEGEGFEAVLAPDRFHKHEISGGGPYTIALPCPAADGLVLEKPNQLRFVE